MKRRSRGLKQKNKKRQMDSDCFLRSFQLDGKRALSVKH